MVFVNEDLFAFHDGEVYVIKYSNFRDAENFDESESEPYILPFTSTIVYFSVANLDNKSLVLTGGRVDS